jgi:hypothetical protein
MMKRSFTYLAILTFLALLVVLVFVPQDRSSGPPVTELLLLPDIAGQINAVTRVEIISSGDHSVATMTKSGDHWKLGQMDGYRANWPLLQALLAGLAQASVIEVKTDKPEYYARLGVEDVAAEGAGSVLVRISIADQTTGILIGHQARGRPGQYVRLQNAAASALVDRKLDVSTELLDWVDSAIVDIDASEVAEVEIIHPQGERVLVARISADQTDFDLVGLPPDRETRSSWAVNSLGSVFSMLNLETVRPVGNVDWADAVKMRLLMFSGVEIMADLVEAGGEYLLRLHASYPEAKVTKINAATANDTLEQQDIEQRAAEDVAKTVSDINQRVTGWAYGITKQKYDAMVSKPEDLLKPLESP